MKILEQHKFLSLTFGGLCVLCWSYYNVLCDLVAHHFDNYFILLGAVITNTVFVTPILKFTYKDLNIKGGKQWASILCFGFFDVMLILLMSFAFQHAPIGDAACLFAMRVIWTPLVESFVNKKCISLSHAIVMILAVAGAILITQPEFLGFHNEHDPDQYKDLYLAYLLALVAGIIAGLQYIFLAVCPDVHWSVWQVVIIPAGLIISPLAFYFFGSEQKVASQEIDMYFLIDLGACFLIAWFDILGRLCRTIACKEHTPSTVSLVSVLEIPFTYAWGWIYVGQAMSPLEIGGALLVMVAVLLSSTPCFSDLDINSLQAIVGKRKGRKYKDNGRDNNQSEYGDSINSMNTSGYDSIDGRQHSHINSNNNYSDCYKSESDNSIQINSPPRNNLFRELSNKETIDEETGLLFSSNRKSYLTYD